MSARKGFTLVELLMAVAVFSLVTSLVVFAFAQSLSLWERADRAAGAGDDLAFFGNWLRTLIHAADNLKLPYRGLTTAIFFGDERSFLFVSRDPLLNDSRLASFIRLEWKEGACVYAEQSFFSVSNSLIENDVPQFAEQHELIRGVEEGAFSYLTLVAGKESWVDRFDASMAGGLPRAVRSVFVREGRRWEITANILCSSRGRSPGLVEVL